MTIDLEALGKALLREHDENPHAQFFNLPKARFWEIFALARQSQQAPAQDTYRADIIEAAAEAIAMYGTTHFGDATPYAEQSMGAKAIRRGEARAALSVFTAALRSEASVLAVQDAISKIKGTWVSTADAELVIEMLIKSVGGGE